MELHDSHKVEAVIMPYNYGNVLCVSSQVGCNMGCSFCASGLLGKQRNLDTSEMVGQVLLANMMLEEKGKRITHVVVSYSKKKKLAKRRRLMTMHKLLS